MDTGTLNVIDRLGLRGTLCNEFSIKPSGSLPDVMPEEELPELDEMDDGAVNYLRRELESNGRDLPNRATVNRPPPVENDASVSDGEEPENRAAPSEHASNDGDEIMSSLVSPGKNRKRGRADVNHTFLEIEIQKKESRKYEIDSQERREMKRFEMEERNAAAQREHDLHMERLRQENAKQNQTQMVEFMKLLLAKDAKN